ncbi:MAG TPA: transposase [Vicinamibacterales bacterium]|jgi:putative transposase
MNRAARKSRLFDNSSDYAAFQDVVSDALSRFDVAFFSYIVMPNHWHFLLSPRVDRGLSRFMHWLETTHARRWGRAKGVEGQGAVYQGRFKAIPIEADRHFLWVCRYVERNALRANLVERAEDWRWSSLWQRQHQRSGPTLSPWPVTAPVDWLTHVNTPQTDAEIESFRRAVNLGQPYGEEEWSRTIGVGTARPRGRPRRVLNK